MQSKIFCVAIATVLMFSVADAQVFIGGRFGGPRYGRGMQQRPPRDRRHDQSFTPSVSLSLGYGFPNLDKDQLPDYYNFYKGAVTQKGPFTGSVDYQFSRNMSIGVLVTHGTLNMPYYDYNNTSIPAMRASVDNWSYMLNFVRYMPVSKNFDIYVRTAIGLNSWKQEYSDISGNELYPPASLPDLAYQVGLGARYNFTKHSGIFLEAGYGKYILHGGLSFKL